MESCNNSGICNWNWMQSCPSKFRQKNSSNLPQFLFDLDIDYLPHHQNCCHVIESYIKTKGAKFTRAMLSVLSLYSSTTTTTTTTIKLITHADSVAVEPQGERKTGRLHSTHFHWLVLYSTQPIPTFSFDCCSIINSISRTCQLCSAVNYRRGSTKTPHSDRAEQALRRTLRQFSSWNSDWRVLLLLPCDQHSPTSVYNGSIVVW